MSDISRTAAIAYAEYRAEKALFRDFDQAIAIVSPRTPRTLLALEPARDDMTAPGAAHPASRALRESGRDGHA